MPTSQTNPVKNHLTALVCVSAIVALECPVQAESAKSSSPDAAIPAAPGTLGVAEIMTGAYFNLGVSLQGDYDITAEEGVDLSAFSPSVTFSPGVRLDCGFQMALAQNWALQLETGVIYNSIDTLDFNPSANGSASVPMDGSLLQVPLFANLLYHIPIQPNFQLYLGAGVGGMFSFLDMESDNTSAAAFSYQAIAGMSYQVNDSMDIGLAYKFTGTLSQTFSDLDTYNNSYWGYYGYANYNTGTDKDVEEAYNHSILVTFTFRF